MKVRYAQVDSPPQLVPRSLRISVFAAGILAGVVLGVSLTEASLGPSAELWIGYHQAIRVPYTVVVPPLGVVVVVALLITLIGPRRRQVRRLAITVAVICLVVGMAITIGVHFPMNAMIDTWLPTTPPDDWEQVRRQWVIAHSARSVLAVAAFGLLLVATPSRLGAPKGLPATHSLRTASSTRGGVVVD